MIPWFHRVFKCVSVDYKVVRVSPECSFTSDLVQLGFLLNLLLNFMVSFVVDFLWNIFFMISIIHLGRFCWFIECFTKVRTSDPGVPPVDRSGMVSLIKILLKFPIGFGMVSHKRRILTGSEKLHVDK
jgi:hypothetical protein